MSPRDENKSYTKESLNRCRLTIPIPDLSGAPVVIRLSISLERSDLANFHRKWESIMIRKGLTLLEIVIASALLLGLSVAATEALSSAVFVTRSMEFQNDLAWEASRIEIRAFSRTW